MSDKFAEGEGYNKYFGMNSRRKKSRSSTRQPKKKNRSSLVIFLIIIILIYLFIQGDQGFLRYVELKKEKARLTKKIEALKKENQNLQDEIELLRNNYRYIEKIARERHQMGKDGEKIYIINPPRE